MLIVWTHPVDSLRSLKQCSVNYFMMSTPPGNQSSWVAISLSPHSCGSGIVTRVLFLHTWLQSAYKTHSISFIDNFNLFWGRKSFFKSCVFHPNKLGGQTAKLQHAVLKQQPGDWLHCTHAPLLPLRPQLGTSSHAIAPPTGPSRHCLLLLLALFSLLSQRDPTVPKTVRLNSASKSNLI